MIQKEILLPVFLPAIGKNCSPLFKRKQIIVPLSLSGQNQLDYIRKRNQSKEHSFLSSYVFFPLSHACLPVFFFRSQPCRAL